MMKDQEILDVFRKRINQFLDDRNWWREQEVLDSFGVYDGTGQWLQEDVAEQEKAKMPVQTINKTAPVVDAVSGFQIQNAIDIDFTARNAATNQEIDIVQVVSKYIEHDSGQTFENNQAFADMLKCGVGAVNHEILFEEDNIDGDPSIRRIYPYLLAFDTSARRKNLRDASWVCEAKIISDEVAREETGDEFISGGTGDERFLQYFQAVNPKQEVTMAYDYQWRERVNIYRGKNPFYKGELQVKPNPALVAYLEIAKEKYGFDPLEDSVITVEGDKRADLIEELKHFGVDIKLVRQKKYRYYRAKIIGNTVVDKEENFSQKGFSIKFMTGKFDETLQAHYGLIRSMKHAQRLLNKAVSDYQGFLSSIPMGGYMIEETSTTDIKGFKDSLLKSKMLTVIADGKTGTVMPKPIPPMPDGLMEMISFAMSAIMEVVGVTPSLMGEIDSKNMTGLLQGQLVRSGLAVLAVYFDAYRYFMKDQAKLKIDMCRVLAESNEGRAIKNLTGKGDQEYVKLQSSDIAQEYDIELGEVPQTPNEKAEIFTKLIELVQMLVSINPSGAAGALSIAMPFSPLPKEQQDQAIALMQPAPAPEPDPNAIALLQAETAEKMSTANKNAADAKLKEMETLLKLQELSQGKDGDGDGEEEQQDPEWLYKMRQQKIDAQKLVIEQDKLEVERMKIRADLLKYKASETNED